ncbi:MAG: purine-binding chemotaxis protein CheW [Symploca sp. SIO3E6]|nr:purine-binding chemotaxis protein CheW [Caldora sp. SIO3E6]
MKVSSSNSSILSPQSLPNKEFLRFYLEPDTTTLLPLQQLTEVLTISIGEIVPIPHMSPWVMGVYNWRGDILWIVDLGHLVGLTPWYQQTSNVSVHKAIVLKASGNRSAANNAKTQMLGLVVNRIEDIELCNPDLIQSPPSSTVTPELVPFLRGYWLKPDSEMLVVLDGEAIMAAMPKPSN